MIIQYIRDSVHGPPSKCLKGSTMQGDDEVGSAANQELMIKRDQQPFQPRADDDEIVQFLTSKYVISDMVCMDTGGYGWIYTPLDWCQGEAPAHLSISGGHDGNQGWLGWQKKAKYGRAWATT
jgi:hypothetical protein